MEVVDAARSKKEKLPSLLEQDALAAFIAPAKHLLRYVKALPINDKERR